MLIVVRIDSLFRNDVGKVKHLVAPVLYLK